MAVLKCKMCGGDLNIMEGATVCECEYCGTKQTVPSLDNDKKTTLFARANRLRFGCEFDKAAGVYESIVADFPEEAEAYWGLVLCKYGIEYVDDPATAKKIPTCHRSSFESVMDDGNFEMVLEYADTLSRQVYREEAKQIEELRKGIIEVSSKEEPYDIFICYKETAENGDRTLDSVIAQDVYDALCEKGYRVFFSRITLEDKLGVEYEPYIFAALNSAKIMLAFGTDYEYYNAVWVKNEWSRFLQLIAKGEKKTLIPCYKNIDAYDMPKEFAKLQAQDMGKVGAIQDLLRGIEKILPKNKNVVEEIVVARDNNSEINPLLKRAFMFLEDGDFARADEFCEQVLNHDPECAEAYLGKLMAELRVKKQDDLNAQPQPFNNSDNYQKIIRFGNEKLKVKLYDDIDNIKIRNENARIDNVYNEAKTLIKNAVSNKEFETAIDMFESIGEYKDSVKQIKVCKNKIEELKTKAETKRIKKEQASKKCIAIIKKMAIIVTAILCAIVVLISVYDKVIIPKKKYNNAISLMNEEKYSESKELFKALGGYKDSVDKIEECNARIYGEELWNEIKNIKIGDTYMFGSYEQTTPENKDDIEWIVLSKDEARICVISKYVLFIKEWNKYSYYKNITWENSSIRFFLNNDFYNAAFSEKEKSMIPMVTVSVDAPHSDNVNPGNNTQDKIFLLSENEAFDLEDHIRTSKPTQYAVDTTTLLNDISIEENFTWWTRSLGGIKKNVVAVDSTGWCYSDGYDAQQQVGIRPAMWIDLSK